MSSSDGRVVVITGAGGGIGRAEALLFAQEGARVVVNDVSAEGASAVVEEVRAAGGEAVANTDDISDWDGAGRLVQLAVDTYGGLDTLVNNAGILRDRMFVNMTVEDWDAVMRVHLRGTFCPSKHAVTYWRERSKAGDPAVARIVNTSSPSGIYGNIGQANYGAAKAGLAGLTRVLAIEGAGRGIKVNAIAPIANTRMTQDLLGELSALVSPETVSPLVAYLAHEECVANGHVYSVAGGRIARIVVAETDGVLLGDNTAEVIRDRIDALDDVSGPFHLPSSLDDETMIITKALAAGL